MREILFRGKQVTDKKWVVGGIDTVTDENKTYICRRARYRPDTRDWDTAEYYEKNPHCTRADIEVLPETVGQFTGLLDKNGKKIFEGDIIKTKYGRLCIVTWFSGPSSGEWDMTPISTAKNIFETSPPDIYDLFTSVNLEIVGNVHDNPELMEDQS